MNQIAAISDSIELCVYIIRAIELQIACYHTDDPRDAVVDQLSEIIGKYMKKMVALPIGSPDEAMQLLNCVERYMDFPADRSKMSRENQILCGTFIALRTWIEKNRVGEQIAA